MAYSRVVLEGDGTTTQFAVNFAMDYLLEADVTCRVGNEVDGSGNPSYRAITFLTTNLLQVAGPPAGNGVRVTFDRTIDKDELRVNFSNGDQLDEDNLDTAQKQAMMAVHEVLDGRFGTLTGDVNAGGFSVTNMRQPVSNSDAATKAYVDSNNSSTEAAAAAASAIAAASSATSAQAASAVAAADKNATHADKLAADTSASNASASAAAAAQSAIEAKNAVGGGAQIDALFFDQRVSGMHLSEAAGVPVFFGPDGSAIHDGFTALDYVDISPAVGLDTSTAGELRTLNITSTTDTTAATSTTGDLSGGTVVNMSQKLRNSRTVDQLGIYSTTARTYTVKIVQRTAAGVFNTVVSQSLVHTGGGMQYLNLSSAYAIPATGDFYPAHYYATGTMPTTGGTLARAFLNAVDSSIGSASGYTETATSAVSQFGIRYTAISNATMTVSSFAITSAEAPDNMFVALRMRDTAGIVLNTDVQVKVSRDNGTTWTTTTLTEKFIQPGNVRVLYTGAVPVNGQPAGTSLKWRIQTFNSKTPAFLSLALWANKNS